MSTNDDLPSSAPRSPTRKKKRRPLADASVVARPVAPVEPRDESKQWTTGQLAVVLAIGLGVGGFGGYLAASSGGDSAGAAKDQPSSASASGKQKGEKAPQPGAYVPLASWTPREGAEQAKVTIIEFSDFQ